MPYEPNGSRKTLKLGNYTKEEESGKVDETRPIENTLFGLSKRHKHYFAKA